MTTAHLSNDLWVSRTTSRTVLTIAALAATNTLLTKPRHPKSLARAAIAAGLASLLGTIRIIATPDGITIGLGPWGWPAKRINIETIAAAETGQLSPLEYGGWGLRHLPGRTALLLHSGPALILHLTTGHQLAISTANPEQAVAVLQHHLAFADPQGPS